MAERYPQQQQQINDLHTGCSARTFFLQFFFISLNSSSVLSQLSNTVASVMSRSPRHDVSVLLFVIAIQDML